MPRTPRRRRWAIAVLGLYVAAAALVLFAPISYADVVHAVARVVTGIPGLGFFGSGWIEFVANILLFVPLGFLFAILLRRWWAGALVGLLLSTAIELSQLLIPYRQATVRDVISNTTGAIIGALIAWLIVLRRQRTALRDAPPTATRRAR